MKDDHEIMQMLDKANDSSIDSQGKYRGMSYEDGIREALEWVLGYNETLLED